jgi:hypothetical protein
MTTFGEKVKRVVQEVKAAAAVVRDRVLVGLGAARLKAEEVRRRVTVAVARVQEFVGREFPEAERKALAEAVRRGAVAVRERAKVLGRVAAVKAAEAGQAAGRRIARAAAALRRVAVAAAQDAAGGLVNLFVSGGLGTRFAAHFFPAPGIRSANMIAK